MPSRAAIEMMEGRPVGRLDAFGRRITVSAAAGVTTNAETQIPEAIAGEGDPWLEEQRDPVPLPLTIARAKMRRFIEAVGIKEAVLRTGIPRSTLLALRLGRFDDPKGSQIRALERHAGIGLHDWATLVPALRRPGS